MGRTPPPERECSWDFGDARKCTVWAIFMWKKEDNTLVRLCGTHRNAAERKGIKLERDSRLPGAS